MISVSFVVYGKNLDEIKSRAKMIARRFFGGTVPTLTMRCEFEPALDLYKAEVDADVDWEPDGS